MEYSILEQRSVIRVLVAEKCKPYEIYERMCDVNEEAYFNQKMFTNQLNIGLPQQARVEMTVHGMETHWLSCKEKVSGSAVSKEGHADMLLRQRKYNY